MSQFQNGPFDVSADDLGRVTPEQAVEIVKQLLVAEAIEIGIPVTGVDVSSAITTPDGGVDAVVSLVDRPRMTGGLLRDGHVRYQIKSGSFSASNEGELKSLIFRPGTPATAENVNHRVKACLDANGTFIAVLFGAELTGTKEGYGENELKTLLSGVGYPNAKVEILRANQLGTAIKVLAPALALQINGISSPDGAPLFWLEHLEKSVGLLPSKFVDTETRRPHIAAIKQLANNLKGFRHVRIIGDPGSGKTHLAYEAVANSLSKGLVLYTESPDKMVESALMGRLIATAKGGHIVLIADDCDL